MKVKPFFIRNLLLCVTSYFLFFSCSKKYELANLEINDASYTVVSLNDCPLEGGSDGSTITVTMQVDMLETDSLYALQSLSSFDETGKANIYRNLLIDEISGEVEITYCIRFAQETSITYQLTLITIDGKASNTFEVVIPRPSGSNLQINSKDSYKALLPKQKRVIQ